MFIDYCRLVEDLDVTLRCDRAVIGFVKLFQGKRSGVKIQTEERREIALILRLLILLLIHMIKILFSIIKTLFKNQIHRKLHQMIMMNT